MQNPFKPQLKDLHAYFLKTFDTPHGKKVLEHLDKHSKQGFPNTQDVNYTFAKAGQMQLVDYIKGVIKLAKKGSD